MKAVAIARVNNTTYFLTEQGLCSDIRNRARTFRDAADAQTEVNKQNVDPAWLGIKWRATYMMHDGTIAPL